METTAAEGNSWTLSLDLAAQDSPEFRANLQRLEDGVEQLSAWLEPLCRSLKLYTDEIHRDQESSALLSNRVMPPADHELIDAELSLNALRTFADALQCVYPFKAKLMDDLQDYLWVPLQQFFKDDIRDMREQRRIFERIADRYDSALQRYAALSKTKEASSLREDAFQLYDIRKLYIRASMDYTARSLHFKHNVDRIILDRFTDAMESILDYYQNAAEIYRGLKPRIDQLKNSLQVRKTRMDIRLDTLDDMKNQMEETTINGCKPSSALPLSNPTSSLRPSIKPDSKTEKQGHLFKRTQPKSAIVTPTWIRRWCFIKNGKFGYQTLARQRGMVASAAPISVLLCEVRVDDRQERRYCFEVISSKKSLLFQAESEQDLMAWLETFEAAKRSMMASNMAAGRSEERVRENAEKFTMDDEEWDSVTSASLLQRNAALSNVSDGDEQAFQFLNVKYPDITYERKNAELRSIVQSIPNTDKLLESFPAALVKDTMIRGRAYITQNHLCFYSNILSIITTVVVPFQNIQSIQRKPNNQLLITTSDAQHTLKTFFKDDIKIFGALNTVMWNARSEQPMSVQKLFDTIYESYRPSCAPEDMLSDDTDDLEDLNGAEDGQPLSDQNEGSVKGAAVPLDWPKDLPVPKQPVQCGCTDHYEKMDLNLLLPLPAKKLFDLIFDTPAFFTNVHKKRGDWDWKISDWYPNPDNATQQKRDLNWQFTVNNPMTKIKETDCHEQQFLLKRTEHLCYVVDTLSKTVNMPYGDAFATQARFCITFHSQTQCRLQCSIGVKFYKTLMIKMILKSAAMQGIADYIRELGVTIQALARDNAVPQLSGPRERSISRAGKKGKKKKSQDEQVDIKSKIGEGYPWPICDLMVHAHQVWSLKSGRLLMIGLIVSFMFNMLLFNYSYQHVNPFGRTTTLFEAIQRKQDGVYLKDLEERILNQSSVQLSQSQLLLRRQSFHAFLEQQTSYQWHAVKHAQHQHRLHELNHESRQLRRTLLLKLHELNQLEQQLMEWEYVNWMQDQLEWCWHVEQRQQDDSKPVVSAACRRLQFDLQLFLMNRLQ